jgi:uncharacterized protein YndB with AHSA1/START domain
MSTDPESHEFEVQRVIAADQEAVFDGFVQIYDGDDRPDWILSSEMDLRVGGEWVVELELPGMEPFSEVRTITELDRPKRLAYSMTTRGADSEEAVSTEVGLSFEPRSGHTLVKLDQRGFRSSQQAEKFERAWPQVLALVSERIDG